MKFDIDAKENHCHHCDRFSRASVLEIGGTTLPLCRRCTRQLVAILPRARSPRGINRKQFEGLKAIHEIGNAELRFILMRMGRYSTNSFASLLSRGLIVEADNPNLKSYYQLTSIGRALYEGLKFEYGA